MGEYLDKYKLNKAYNEDCNNAIRNIPTESVTIIISECPVCLFDFMKSFKRIMKPNAVVLQACIPNDQWKSTWTSRIESAGLEVKQSILTTSFRDKEDFDWILVAGKKDTHICNAPSKIQGEKVSPEKRLCMAERSIDVYKRLIELYSEPGDVVLDLCAGSGSAGHASLLLGRYYLGFDIVHKSVNAINNRLKEVM